MRRLVLTGIALAALAVPGPCLAKDDYRGLRRRWEDACSQLERSRLDETTRKKAEATLHDVAPKMLKADQRHAVKLLLDKGLGSPSRTVFESSLRVLAQTDDKHAVRLVIKAFDRAKALGRKRRLAKILATLPGDDVVKALVKALREREPWVRQAAAAALGERGVKAKGDAEHPLERIAKRDDSILVRKAAADALELIGVSRPKGLPPAKTNDAGLPDRFYADRVAFLLDATVSAARVAYQDPFTEEGKEKEKELGEEDEKKEKGAAKPAKPRSPYQLVTKQVLAAVKRMDRDTTRFTALRFGGQVSFFEREFLKPNRRSIESLETWTRTLPGRDQNRDVARAVEAVLRLDPPPQVIYVFLTGPAIARGRLAGDEALRDIENLVDEKPVKIHVVRLALPPLVEPRTDLAKARLKEAEKAYGAFAAELAKIGGGDAHTVELATAQEEEKKDDKSEPKAEKLGIDMTKPLSRRDTSRLKKALRIRKGRSDKEPAEKLVEQIAACPDARKATPIALDELRGDDPDLAEAALRGFERNTDAKVHAELLKELKSERDPVFKMRLLRACAKHPGQAITAALIDMTGNTRTPDFNRAVWRVLSERPAPELANAKSKVARKARGARRGLTAFYANTTAARAAGRQPPSSSGLSVGPRRFLPARFNADGVAFVIDSNYDMKQIFWRPPPPLKTNGKKDEKKKKKRRPRRRRNKQDEAKKEPPPPVTSMEAATQEVERALRAAAKGGVSANVLLTGGRSWKSGCSPLGRGSLQDALNWLKGLRTGGQRDVWTGLQRALNDSGCELIYLLVSGLPIRSPGADGKVDELLRKVDALNGTRGIAINVVYVLPPVPPDDTRAQAARSDLLRAMDALYKPLAAGSGGQVLVRHQLSGLGQKPKPAK